jgi:hypothetical protein
LQHGRVLTLTERGHEYSLPIGKLKRIVMHVCFVFVNVPESSYLLLDLLATRPFAEEAEAMLVLDLVLESDLCARQKAHSYVWFSDRSESASDGFVELCRYQLVCDLCRSRCNDVKTVIAH